MFNQLLQRYVNTTFFITIFIFFIYKLIINLYEITQTYFYFNCFFKLKLFFQDELFNVNNIQLEKTVKSNNALAKQELKDLIN